MTDPGLSYPLTRGASLIAALAVASFGACAAPTASADPPPNCTGADFAGVSAGVSAAMSSYLFTHPDVNDYITGLEASGGDQTALQIARYEAAHPQERAEIVAIRQPLADFDTRCGYGNRSHVDLS